MAGMYTCSPKWGPSIEAGFCGTGDYLGYIDWSSRGSLVVLCKMSFTGVGLNSVAASPASASLFVNDETPSGVMGQTIGDIAPQTMTLYYKLSYLV